MTVYLRHSLQGRTSIFYLQRFIILHPSFSWIPLYFNPKSTCSCNKLSECIRTLEHELWLGKRELICLLLFTCNYMVSFRRGFLFLWVLGMGYVILLLHSLSLPYNYFGFPHVYNIPLKRNTTGNHKSSSTKEEAV